MRSKRLYLLTIFYISVFAITFKFLYPEVKVTALITLIALVGFGAALGTNLLISRQKRHLEEKDGKSK